MKNRSPIHSPAPRSFLAALSLLLTLASAGCAGMFARKPPESVEILDRKETAPSVQVKHVLIGWSWLAAGYRQSGLTIDPRAEQRNQEKAEALATEILNKLRAGEPIEALMKQYSEDEGSNESGIAYPVSEQSRLSEDFIELSLRLKVGESGIVKSKYGYHIIQRVE